MIFNKLGLFCGVDGKDAPKIWTGETAPTSSIGNEGDFYLDLKNKVLYGPKTNGSWGEGIVLGGGSSSLKGNYALSADGKTLLYWFDRETRSIDMEADAELRNVTRIGARVFTEQNILNTIVLPKGLEYIGAGAFMSNKLTNIEIPNSVTYIGWRAFSSNQLTSVSIPNSVTSIESYTFSSNQLTSVVIPNSVTYIGEYAFNSNQLTSVSIPNSVTSIGSAAFANNQLTSVSIPNGVRVIGSGAFAYNKLTSVEIPNSVTSIEDRAFYNQLTSVVMKSSTPPRIGSQVFGIGNLVIYVPKGSSDAYINHQNWRPYKDLIVEQ